VFEIPENTLTIFSSDSAEKLLEIYNKIYKTVNGRTISEIALVYQQLKDWTTIEKAELIIPFKYTEVRNEPMGHRIWYLSQKESSRYYNGCWFDIKEANTRLRCIRKGCKLSIEAIKLFEKFTEIGENKPC